MSEHPTQDARIDLVLESIEHMEANLCKPSLADCPWALSSCACARRWAAELLEKVSMNEIDTIDTLRARIEELENHVRHQQAHQRLLAEKLEQVLGEKREPPTKYSQVISIGASGMRSVDEIVKIRDELIQVFGNRGFHTLADGWGFHAWRED